MNRKPQILVTNDDGIYAPGIYALCNAMSELGDTYVVAPDSEQSAIGHAITISDPLRVKEFEKNGNFFGWAVNGTPADCVKLAIKAILNVHPDLVVSGINSGSNTATNVIYSGTVSAATEGTIMGIPSIAFSLTTFQKVDLTPASEIAQFIARLVLQQGLPKDTLLNVNIPPLPRDEIRGIKLTRQGKARYEETFEKRVDPMNRVYYWLGGSKVVMDSEEDIDDIAIMNGYVSVTPLHFDLTDYRSLQELKHWRWDLNKT